ncbi:MAG: hypothetical protein QM713_11070 [Arachnia sp.]
MRISKSIALGAIAALTLTITACGGDTTPANTPAPNVSTTKVTSTAPEPAQTSTTPAAPETTPSETTPPADGEQSTEAACAVFVEALTPAMNAMEKVNEDSAEDFIKAANEAVDAARDAQSKITNAEVKEKAGAFGDIFEELADLVKQTTEPDADLTKITEDLLKNTEESTKLLTELGTLCPTA